MSIKSTFILLFIFICTCNIQGSEEEKVVMTVTIPKSDSWVSIVIDIEDIKDIEDAADESWEYNNEIYSSYSEKLKNVRFQLLEQAAKKALTDSFSSDEESESSYEQDDLNDFGSDDEK